MFSLKQKIQTILITILLLNPTFVFAQTSQQPQYGGVDQSISEYLCTPSEQADGRDLERCINKMYRFSIAFGAIALVFFIVFAGYMYITGGETGKGKAKGILQNALIGIGLLLGAYVLLGFINPNLLLFKTIQPPIFEADDIALCADLGFGENCVIADGHNAYYSTGTGTLGPCKSGFKSEAEARAEMETFQVNTWSKSGNSKSTVKRSVTVQKCIAAKTKAALEAIYASPEKFPIKEIESFTYRAATGSGGTKLSAHGMGLAIDINDNENYFICTHSKCKTKQVGSFWKPCPGAGCSEFSMPATGSVVTAFKSQGFGWGGNWNNIKDYMHFSCYPSEQGKCF